MKLPLCKKKAIMKRSRLRNIFPKHKTDTSNKNYSTQRSFGKKLLKNTKKSYFENLDTKKITDNRSFWRTALHYLPKIHQNVKKLTSLVILEPYLVTRSSVRHLINFSLMYYPSCTYQNLSLFRWQVTILILLCL